jgi:hypothetical protein
VELLLYCGERRNGSSHVWACGLECDIWENGRFVVFVGGAESVRWVDAVVLEVGEGIGVRFVHVRKFVRWGSGMRTTP